MKMKNKVELLAPAGSFEAMIAAIDNGCDAIYLGGKNFSARAFAKNFDHQEIIDTINYCHLRNVKVYITVNTLLNEYEINNVIKEIDFYYENKVDALIIQDLGLYYLIRNKYPDFELHCSTQMHIHNISGIKTAKRLGFNRVVIARESSLSFMKEACNLDIEIECFIHGAICVSYSGQCLMSSVTNNRSANKGMCAQCCRMDYQLKEKDTDKVLNKDNPYIISPKDMFLLNDLPELIDAGISSFKIEGRMKSPAYVGYVTSIYRQAIDAYYNNEEFNLNEEILNNLKVLFNRDFTDAYLNNNYDDIFAKNKPNHLGILIGKVINTNNNKVKIKLFNDLRQFDGIRISDKKYEEGFIVNYLYKDGKLINEAFKDNIIELKTNYNFKNDALVYKTIDYKLEKEILSRPHKRLPLDLNIICKENKEIIISGNIYDYNFIFNSNIICQKAIKAPLNKENIIKQFSKLNDTPYYLNNINIILENIFLPIKDINDIRRSLIEYINQERINSFKRYKFNNEYKLNDLIDQLDKIDIVQGNSDKKDIINIKYDNPINNNDEYNNVIYDIGGILNNIDNKIAYYTLNITNSYAYELLMRLGFKYIILSTELNKNEIDKLIEEYEIRTNHKIIPHVFYEGSRALMYLRANPFKEYMDEDKVYELSTNNHIFDIKNINEIIEISEKKHKNLEFNEKCNKFYILNK